MSQLPTNCQSKTKVDRYNKRLICFKNQSIVPDILIKPSLKCEPFMSYRCEPCNCKSPGLRYWPSYCPKNKVYIYSWITNGDCAFIGEAKCGEGQDAPIPEGYTIPSCFHKGKVMKWTRDRRKSSPIAYDIS